VIDETSRRISEAMQGLARGIDEAIEEIAGERVAFTLIIYSEKVGSYISTASREDNIEQFALLTEQWANGVPDVPAHLLHKKVN
jgi:hypothetical protein